MSEKSPAPFGPQAPGPWEDVVAIMNGINEARLSGGISQAALAQETGTQQSAVSEALSLRVVPTLHLATRLAHGVGARIGLLPDESEPPQPPAPTVAASYERVFRCTRVTDPVLSARALAIAAADAAKQPPQPPVLIYPGRP